MSQGPSGTNSAAGVASFSESGAEKHATSAVSPGSHLSAPTSAPTPKLRSCVVCRTRKVRCDKQSPCSNCRRANIACVFQSRDRPPRWARRLERVANNAASNAQAAQESEPAAAQVIQRLRNLENLVKDLSGQLEQANAAAASAAGGSSAGHSPASSGHDRETHQRREANSSTDTTVKNRFGRLVAPDANRSRYVSSGFWSRLDDELDGLQIDSRGLAASDSGSSEDEASPGKSPSTQELNRTPSERHAFLFRHNLSPSTPDFREFRPLRSQIPFLLDVFAKNINSIIGIVHIPTVSKIARDSSSSDRTNLTTANEALLFSIYYAAVSSMEEDDVMTDFGFTKADLNLKYRLGLEHALAKADFLNVPDLVLVQAFTIFLCLARRHDSPRFVWMMTGIVIRMAQALGLHRDGAHFDHLTPFQIEMRRRAWWVLCMVDVRASEDQGTDFTIAYGSFDTRLPLNVNDADIDPEMTQTPTERIGITDMTFPLVSSEMSEVTKHMIAHAAKHGTTNMEEQSHFLNEIYQKLETGYLQFSVESDNINYWVAVVIARLMMAKMTLFVYLPILFSAPSEQLSANIRTNLLVAAIEVSEYNHALNAEQACRHWRWVYQTYTHWHAVIYLLIEISRRPWSPLVERAWVALHSPWLIPSQSHMDKNLRFWVPLRKLMAKARRYREAEIGRLKSDAQAAIRLEEEDQKISHPASPGLFPGGSDVAAFFRERWRQLLSMPNKIGLNTQIPGQSGPHGTGPMAQSINTTQASMNSIVPYGGGVEAEAYHNVLNNLSYSAPTTNAPNDSASGQTPSSNNAFQTESSPWSMGPGLGPWLWADADPSVDVFAGVELDSSDINMDLDGEVDWYNLIESAKGMEWDIGPSGS
ncbi:MAG: hypothetical protein Q9227_009067 [Pyrenula ochraceoflavens]